jgi:hypothetical protein
MPNQPIAFLLLFPAVLPAAGNLLRINLARVKDRLFNVNFPIIQTTNNYTGACPGAETSIAIHHPKKSLLMP